MTRGYITFALAAAVGCSDRAIAQAPPIVRDAGVASEAPRALGVAQCDDDAKPAEPVHDQLTLTRVKFADLPGWSDDKHADAVPAFLKSCEKLAGLPETAPAGADGHGGLVRHWRKACAAAAKVPAGDHAAARAMFEAQFTPFAAAGKAGGVGKFTGYFVQELHASRKRGGKYQYPVLRRPPDLVMVDLGLHIKDGHGRRIWGRLDSKGELVPYYTRKEIREGKLDGRALELMYADDPVDLLFAQIEGSAKAVLDDGSVVWLEFAGKNGRAYRGVGGVLKGMGELKAKGSGTMQGIRAWFAANPKRFDEVVDQSPSYVFFSEAKAAGAVGSQMVVLTAARSLAVDRAFVAHTTPVWVETKAPVPGKLGTESAWRQLLIAQDTGGGILGAVRADVYWGDDAKAAELGGRMGGSGKAWLLLPNGVAK